MSGSVCRTDSVGDKLELGCTKHFRVDVSGTERTLMQTLFLLVKFNLQFNTHSIKIS